MCSFFVLAYLALHGKRFTLDFVVPNESFLPSVCNIPFDFQMQDGQLCAFLPESNMTRNTLHGLANHQKLWSRNNGKDSLLHKKKSTSLRIFMTRFDTRWSKHRTACHSTSKTNEIFRCTAYYNK